MREYYFVSVYRVYSVAIIFDTYTQSVVYHIKETVYD
jgi:hypothetical protein